MCLSFLTGKQGSLSPTTAGAAPPSPQPPLPARVLTSPASLTPERAVLGPWHPSAHLSRRRGTWRCGGLAVTGPLPAPAAFGGSCGPSRLTPRPGPGSATSGRLPQGERVCGPSVGVDSSTRALRGQAASSHRGAQAVGSGEQARASSDFVCGTGLCPEGVMCVALGRPGLPMRPSRGQPGQRQPFRLSPGRAEPGEPVSICSVMCSGRLRAQCVWR